MDDGWILAFTSLPDEHNYTVFLYNINIKHYVPRDCIQARLNTLVGWGLQMFMKVLGLVFYMEKMISDPSEPTFVIRVCPICKIPKL